MFSVFGLYTHIRANRIRSALLYVLMFVSVYGFVYLSVFLWHGIIKNDRFIRKFRGMAETENTIFSFQDSIIQSNTTFIHYLLYLTAFIIIWLLVSFLLRNILLRKASGMVLTSRKELPEIYSLLEDLCISCGMAVPQLAVINDPSLNAFASGFYEDEFTITLTTGLIDTLNREEMSAVLAHELTHLKNKDVAVMMVSNTITSFFELFNITKRVSFDEYFRGVMRTLLSAGNIRHIGVNMLILIFIIPLVMILITIYSMAGFIITSIPKLALSRTREYMADAGAVELTKNPDALIAALLKISGRSDIRNATTDIMMMCIDNSRWDIRNLLSTHPTIEERIEALTEFAGGRPDMITLKAETPEKLRRFLRGSAFSSSKAPNSVSQAMTEKPKKKKRLFFGKKRRKL